MAMDKSKKGTEKLAAALLAQLYMADDLKQTSDLLSDISQDTRFKDHTTSIVTDPGLTDAQKVSQLSYVFRQFDNDVLYDYFMKLLKQKHMWVFGGKQVDYFDQFVQAFQKMTEDTELVELTVARALPENDRRKIATMLSEAFGVHVVLRFDVDERVIGGVSLRVENAVYDYTLRSKFQRFEREWISEIKDSDAAVGRNQVDMV